jgi:energy-coupling factor transporter ATP-binding protein EcfA2
MRLKSVYIGEYKNLKDFTLIFNTSCFIDIFVGKNGSGKSNLFEAIILIFKHLIEFGKGSVSNIENYEIIYDLEGKEHTYKWNKSILTYNGKDRKSVTLNTLPDNILVYYSGHNDTVSIIIDEYQEHFSKRIKKADIDESRKFLGIGSGYKSILLGVLLLQPESSKAKKYVCEKLGIPQQEINISLTLKRPVFAKKDFKVDRIDETTFYWGTEGITLNFLKKIVSCIKGSFSHADLYDSEKDIYRIKIDGALYQSVFMATPVTEQFRFFDNLNTLEMLQEMSAEFVVSDGTKATINQFSDGQFQSVYIFSILEFFKDRKCLLLLDEPDSFLHPEWQHGFLKQVLDIAEEKKKKNHILMSSHSASTIAPLDTSLLSLVVIEDSKVKHGAISKSEVIRSLSGDLITFTEEEARLTITQMIDNTEDPILFTEGPSDVNILNIAFKKLYPCVRRPFLIHDAFDRGFLKTLFARQEIFQTNPDKQFFALFDFDDAYRDWKDLGSDYAVCDVSKGLCLKLKEKKAHCFLLPIPDNDLKKQVWDEDHPVDKVIPKPNYCIEHLFWPYVNQAQWFKTDGSGKLVFKGDKHKIKFSKEVVPALEPECFEVFRPMFEFIKGKIP